MAMTSIDENELAYLQKEADDNRAAVRVFRWIAIILIFSVFMFAFGCDALAIRRERWKAYSEVEIREIQSEGMDFDDYIRWLEAKGN